MPRGCQITIVSDSCHSGGLIEESKEQIGESTGAGGSAAGEESSGFGGFGFGSILKQTVQDALASRGINFPFAGGDGDGYGGGEEVAGGVRNRSLPLSTLIDILKQKTGKEDLDVGQLRPALFDIFGEDSSPKVQKFMKVLFDKLQTGGDGGGGSGFMGVVGGLAQQFLKQKLEAQDESYLRPAAAAEVSSSQEVYAGAAKGVLPDCGILISGCQTDQTSADASPPDDPSEAYGALSNAIQKILAETEGQVSNRELVTRARELMVQQGFTQRPGLYCNDEYADAPFVC